jgi:hypothetical protein
MGVMSKPKVMTHRLEQFLVESVAGRMPRSGTRG